MLSHSEQRLVVRLIYDFLREKYSTERGVNKKAAARDLAHSADPDHWDQVGHEEMWRTRVREIIKCYETPEAVPSLRPSVLGEFIDAIRGLGPDGETWCAEHLEISLGVEQQELADECGLSNWQMWNLRFRVFPELDANEKAFKYLLAWLKEAADQYGSQAARGELRRAIDRVQPLWARLSDSEQRNTLARALQEGSGWLSWGAKVAGRTSVVAKRRHGEPTREELADLQKEEEEDLVAVGAGAELLDRRGDGGKTWTELLGSQTDPPQEKVEP